MIIQNKKSLGLASTGKRFLAGFIDYSLIFGMFYVFVTNLGTPNGKGEYVLNGFPALLPVLMWFILTIAMEQIMGATLGNGIMGLKPLSAQGLHKVTLKQSVLRHIADPIDMFPFGLIAFVTINNSDLKQRLGDIWAKTIVINDKS